MTRRLVHVPAAPEEVVLLESDVETLLEVVVVDLLVETVLVEDLALLVVVDDFTVTRVEEALELLLAEDTALDTLLDLTLAHTN